MHVDRTRNTNAAVLINVNVCTLTHKECSIVLVVLLRCAVGQTSGLSRDIQMQCVLLWRVKIVAIPHASDGGSGYAGRA